LEKDEEEEDLDRLVLGDSAGFKALLGQNMDMDYARSSEERDGILDDSSDAVGGLEDVDDADVSAFIISFLNGD